MSHNKKALKDETYKPELDFDIYPQHKPKLICLECKAMAVSLDLTEPVCSRCLHITEPGFIVRSRRCPRHRWRQVAKRFEGKKE